MSEYYGAPNDFRNYLEHHGVKGMKWGVVHEDDPSGTPGRGSYAGKKKAQRAGLNVPDEDIRAFRILYNQFNNILAKAGLPYVALNVSGLTDQDIMGRSPRFAGSIELSIQELRERGQENLARQASQIYQKLLGLTSKKRVSTPH